MKTLLERMPAWREKFWLIPAVAVATAAVGAELLIAIGSTFDVAATPFYDGSADSAQGILSAVATSSLSLAGTVFFITLTALSGVVTVMGPRLLHEFLKTAPSNLLWRSILPLSPSRCCPSARCALAAMGKKSTFLH
nr:DUF2254 family protein [Corynebacterium tuberculostearicum]